MILSQKLQYIRTNKKHDTLTRKKKLNYKNMRRNKINDESSRQEY